MTLIHNLGYPRMGPQRELKHALEAFWQGSLDEIALRAAGAALRRQNWEVQRAAGVDLLPVGDFAWYDHVLTTSAMLGNVPRRFGGEHGGKIDLQTYFTMARGAAGAPAMEMTKWFDTNYHYLVPEFDAGTRFRLDASWLIDEVREALALGLKVKPVVLGPLTYLWLGKEKEPGFDRLSLLPALLPAYCELLAALKQLGVEWVQLDEPALVLDLPAAWRQRIEGAYEALVAGAPRLLLTTYFAGAEALCEQLKRLPVAGLHLDLMRAPQQLAAFARDFPADKVLSLGVIDGRNVWRRDLEQALDLLEPVHQALSDRLWLAPSCSLLHCPLSLAPEAGFDHEVKAWLAFAREKLDELALLRRGLTRGRTAIAYEIAVSNGARSSRALSPRIHNPAVTARIATLPPSGDRRQSPFALRSRLQQLRFDLPRFPTTTIGSFPQTADIRRVRRDFRQGGISETAYKQRMRTQIELVVRKQEALGLDVLVHGEAERNDMVEYFGEQLDGFAFTAHGWVQSYGSRCVKPPIIYGDVSRPRPMTVEWATYAQSLTKKPMKGMLTGPVTILQWSFVRDDQPRATTALQLALAIRAEVQDLERAGIGIIQIDEPALREGLPLKQSEHAAYLEWAARAFRVASGGVRDDTQIHTHMCYAEFSDILPAVVSLDVDVITIETSRSAMDLLETLGSAGYPNAIGPGIYDIHSPRVPDAAEMRALLNKARAVIPGDRLWINPDCGLKTRGWQEVERALANMVAAAKALRQEFGIEDLGRGSREEHKTLAQRLLDPQS
ncbi:MAG: 5-methyltetrahydropteroyltriglutamate--homocysteine S-methyltransferase [Pseudomonadota bacterium]